MRRRPSVLAGLAALVCCSAARAVPLAPVENRLHSPAHRFSLSASVGLSLFDDLVHAATLTVGAGYDPSDWLGIDVRLTGALSGRTALADRVAATLLRQPPTGGTVDDLSDAWEPRTTLLAGVRLSPVYGKFNLGPDWSLRFQAYLWLGGGVSWLHRVSPVVCNQVGSREQGTCDAPLTEDRVAPTASGALGFRVFLGQHGALVLEVRNLVWKDRYRVGIDRGTAEAGRPSGTLAASPGFTHTLFADLGYVVVF